MRRQVTTNPSVTACIAYYGGKRFIRRAVESVLGQTYDDLQVIVVNDGDTDAPWYELASIRDPRLVRFDLVQNHGGPFFANAVVLNAIASPWFLVQEQDDWSAPDRIARLLQLAMSSGADVAISAQYFHQEYADGSVRPVAVRWRHIGRSVCPACKTTRRCQECFVDIDVTREYRYRAPHAALFKSSLLRRIGGYYAGLRLHYDSLLMNLLLMTGKICHTPEPLYNRLLRPNSLTHAKETGFGSSVSNKERSLVKALYQQAFPEYQRYLRACLSSDGLAHSIRHICKAKLTIADKEELACETSRLTSMLVRHRRLTRGAG